MTKIGSFFMSKVIIFVCFFVIIIFNMTIIIISTIIIILGTLFCIYVRIKRTKFWGGGIR